MGERQTYRPTALMDRRGNRHRYWQRVIAAWRRSGLSQAEYCRQSKIARGTFSWWKWRLKQLASEARRPLETKPPSQQPSFMPVHIVAPKERHETLQKGIEVVLSTGRSLRVHGDFDAQVLAKLVAVLEDRQC